MSITIRRLEADDTTRFLQEQLRQIESEREALYGIFRTNGIAINLRSTPSDQDLACLDERKQKLESELRCARERISRRHQSGIQSKGGDGQPAIDTLKPTGTEFDID